MVISTFSDYYDPFIDMDVVFDRMKSESFMFSDFNVYRYTLILDNVCRDFIVRDGRIIMGDEISKYGQVTTLGVKVKCEYDDYFTHCICDVKPYNDVTGFNKHFETKLCIIQNMDPIYNKEKRPFGLDSKFIPEPRLVSLGFDKVLPGHIVAGNLKVLKIK